MRRALDRLANETFDLLIVGGGVTGACVARDAALRGMKVALVERSDFAGATSAHNSKLVHGGLRYLRNFELGLVRESLKERRIWQRIAPHLVHPLPFLVPLYGGGFKARATLGAGLTLYDILSFDKGWLKDPDQRLPNHDWLNRRDALDAEPGARRAGARRRLSLLRRADVCARAAGAGMPDRCGPRRRGHRELYRGGEDPAARWHGPRLHGARRVRRRRVRRARRGNAGRGGTVGGHLPRTGAGQAGVAQAFALQGHPCAGAGDDEDQCADGRGGQRHFFVLPWHGHTLLGTTDTNSAATPARSA